VLAPSEPGVLEVVDFQSVASAADHVVLKPFHLSMVAD